MDNQSGDFQIEMLYCKVQILVVNAYEFCYQTKSPKTEVLSIKFQAKLLESLLQEIRL